MFYIWTVHIYRLYRRQCAKYTYIYSVHTVYYKDIHDDILTSFSQQLLEFASNLGEIPPSFTHKLEHHELAAVSQQHQAQSLLKVPQEALAKTCNPLGAVWTERATDAILPSTTEQSTFLLRMLVLSTPSTR